MSNVEDITELFENHNDEDLASGLEPEIDVSDKEDNTEPNENHNDEDLASSLEPEINVNNIVEVIENYNDEDLTSGLEPEIDVSDEEDDEEEIIALPLGKLTLCNTSFLSVIRVGNPL